MAMLAWLPVGAGAEEVWNLAPVNYESSVAADRLADLREEIEAEWAGLAPVEALRRLLEALDVPESSQVLVFSKTSKQVGLIGPESPRAIYFSEDAYVGHVPGGALEVVVQDPVLGPIFYLLERGEGGRLRVARDDGNCLSCHGSSRTEGVPGMLVRSVFPDGKGRPRFGMGTTDVDARTPVERRWGGYYVTGTTASAHLGNRWFAGEEDREPRHWELEEIEAAKGAAYPRATSDVVALLVLEHQCRMHNLLTAASMQYRRARFLSAAANPGGDPDGGVTERVATGLAERVVDALLFRDEADLGEGATGDPEFQEAWTARFPRAATGESLADFKLYGRVFKNRCSYMIHSEAFEALPVPVKKKVLAVLRSRIEGPEEAAWIGGSEKRRLAAILRETVAGYGG